MSSSAFAELQARIREVESLGSLDPARRSAPPFDVAVSNAVNRGCLVLLSAHLEGFLEDLVTEAIDYLCASGVDVSGLPLLLRAIHAEVHLETLEQSRDRNVRAPKIQALFNSQAQLWASGTPLKSGMLRAELVCKAMNNPGSSEIQSFLQLIGVDLKSHLMSAGLGSLIGRINGLVNKRNQVAHGDPTATATCGDVDEYIRLVGDLCGQTDSAVARAMQSVVGAKTMPW